MKKFYLLLLSLIYLSAFPQGQANWWYFGSNCGVTFNTHPPTAVTNGALNTVEGVASISDVNGNLLFYTDGITVYNRNNVAMTNGTGLLGDPSSTQSAIVVKKPGSANLYYLFTVSLPGAAGGVSYSIIDMTLSGGLGAVTATKNVLVYSPSSERICAVRHCNNKDMWIVSHYDGTNQFYAYLLTAAGLNPTPVISNSGSVSSGGGGNGIGYLKVSPNGSKLAIVMRYTIGGSNQSIIETDDFNNSTGVVSNALNMVSSTTYTYGYGVEFSPDGTRLYANSSGPSFIMQYNLCAGSGPQIVASQVQIGTSSTSFMGAMQLGPDGKIYVANYSSGFLGVINSPNTLGTACNYVDNGISLAGRTSQLGLPNFVADYYYSDTPVIASVISTSNCLHADFNYTIPNQVVSCTGAGNSPVQSLLWDFGNPASGVADTSSQISPTHTFTSSGTYAIRLILNHPCYSDTTTYPLTLTSCGLQVTATGDTICNGGCGNVSATASGTPPYTYTWTPNVGNGPGPYNVCPALTSTYKVVVSDANGAVDSAIATVLISSPPTVTAVAKNISCNGQTDGYVYAQVTGNAPFTYNWNSNPVQTTDTATLLGVGNYAVTVNDANGCSASASTAVSQPPLLVANISNLVNAGCSAGGSGSATVSATGGTGAYTYSWNTVPVQTTATATNLTPGSYIATVTDANGCTDTAGVTIIAGASLNASTIVTNATCNNNNGSSTVTATGGSGTYTYNWNTNPAQTTVTAINLGAGNYIVTVTDGNSCTISATATITQSGGVVASITASTNVSCNGQNTGDATVTATGATTYIYNWNTNPVQTSATANNLIAGTYSVTITDNNSCTASATVTITEPVAISLTFTSATATCGQNNGSVTAAAVGGISPYTYSWATNPVQTTATASSLAAGTYNITVTDNNGCTQTNAGTVQATSAVTVSVATETDVTCFNTTDGIVTLSAAGGTGPYQYSTDSITFNPSASFNNLAPGNYTFYAKDAGGCASSVTAAVSAPAQLVLDTSAQPPLCFGQLTGSASASATGGVPPYTYTWNTTPVSQGSTITNLGAAVYTVTVTDNNNCTAQKSVTINQPQQLSLTVNPFPQATIKLGDSIVLSANGSGGSGNITYNWQASNTLSCILCSTTTATPGNTTVYIITVSDTNNCQMQASVKVNVVIPTQVYIPNAFSPNGDGNNDLFQIYAEGVYWLNMKVFDRWGELVYESENLNEGWDGRYRGKLENPGVFVYTIQISHLDGTTERLNGTVTLLR